MKYLKLFEAKKKKEAFSERIKTTEKDIPEFVEKISDMIEINWELYDLEESDVDNLIKKALSNIKLFELYPVSEAYTKTEILAIKIMNMGASVASAKKVGHKFNFEKFFDGIGSILLFDHIDTKKLTYDGPDITSSSILATNFGIKEYLKNMEHEIERNFDDDDEFAELKIIFGCIFRFGYGIKHDIDQAGIEFVMDRLTDLRQIKEKTKEQLKEYNELAKKFMKMVG